MHKVEKLPQVDGELGWLETAPDSTARLGPRLKGHHAFDVVVIGAGFTGISVALRLAEINPSMRIALVDALRVGEGTSGRNAGFLIDLPHNVDFSKTGVEHAHAQYRLNTFAIERLRQYKDRHAIPCWNDAGKFMAGHEACNLPGLEKFAGMLRQAGFDHEVISGGDLAKRLGTDYYRSAVYTRGNVLVNPAALVRGLIKALPPSVSLFEESPVQGIEYGPPHKLQFLGGMISAPTVVQATNAFAEQFGKLANRLVPIFTYASLTPPLSEAHLRQHFSDVKPWGVTSAHRAGSTIRFTDDKRIFVRNTYDFLGDLRTSPDELQTAWRHHRASFEARFPFLKGVEFAYTWGGMICVTRNDESVFSNAGDGVYVMGGCNGVGVVKGTYLGYYMADYISGIDSENLRFVRQHSSPTWVPPDPLRSITAKVRLAMETRAAKGDA
ncbi:NAD(P)/FAD-dependent oxidoreductase [Ralstonia pseudosolanacearum]